MIAVSFRVSLDRTLMYRSLKMVEMTSRLRGGRPSQDL